jgi:hypothetical protein
MAVRREDLPKLGEIPREVVNVPELGGEIIVQALGLSEYQMFMATVWSTREVFEGKAESLGFMGAAPKLLSLSCIGDDGKPLADEEYWQAVCRKSRDAITELVNVAFKLLNINTGWSVDEIKKNSDQTANLDSPTG